MGWCAKIAKPILCCLLQVFGVRTGETVESRGGSPESLNIKVGERTMGEGVSGDIVSSRSGTVSGLGGANGEIGGKPESI